jgi:apolipoprotein N-acyltransferase
MAPLAWIALAPLLCASFRARPWRGFFLGWLAGTLAYAGILYWIITTCKAADQSLFLSCLCLALLATFLGLYWGIWTAFVALATNRWGQTARGLWGLTPLFAAAWVALEYLRTYLLSGFPWALLADTQWKNLLLIQIAALTGVYGISFLIAWGNAIVAAFLASWKQRAYARPTAAFITSGMLLSLLFSFLYGVHRIQSYRSEPALAPTLAVAVLQGNISQYLKWNQAYVDDIERTYSRLVDEAARKKPELIIWPETSVPGYLLQEPALRQWLTTAIQRSQTYHLVGAPVQESPNRAYNAAFALDARGDLLGEYDKIHLVPFGEIIPFGPILSRWINVLNELGGFTSGTRSSVLHVAGTRVGLNICYEAIFPNLVRHSVRQGAQWVANLTNDGWYMRTAEPWQHFIPNVFRAVENDRWVVRADNTGISGLINPVGHVEVASPIFQTRIVTGSIEPRTALTFYTRFGDLFAALCSLLCLGFGLLAILRRG